MSLMGLDIGTTGCKAVVFDEKGVILASAYREYPFEQPQDNWAEFRPALIWGKAQEVLQEVNGQVKMNPVKALAVSSQGEAVTAVDASGNSLYNIIASFDYRAIEQMNFLETSLSKEILYQKSGMPSHPMYSINKIMWLKQNLPDIFENTWKFMLVEDYIIFQLTGECGIDYSLAARTMAFDVTAKKWSSEILAIAGIEPEKLSPPVPSGTIIANVKKTLRDALGFVGEIPVITGGHDQPCGALGAGVLKAGTAMNSMGTVDAICPIFQKLDFSEAMRLGNYSIYPYVASDFYCTIGINMTGGLLLRWYRDTLCAEERHKALELKRDPYELIMAEMAPLPKDIFFLPHFVGAGTPYFDPLSKGAIVGLKVSTSKADLTRSIIDGINYEMKQNIDYLRQNGIVLHEIRSVGGGSKSKTWLQIKASCFGIPVVKPKVSEAVSLGAAILAGYAIGSFKSIEDGVANMVSIAEVFDPDPELNAIYEEKYLKYKQLYQLLKPFNATLD